MTSITNYLTVAVFAAVAALETAQPQSARKELSLSDIRAQWPQETVFASSPCQRALEAPGIGLIYQRYKVDPATFAPDLNTLMDMSDEVILVGLQGGVIVLSPSGKSVASYNEVKVIRSWKGPHHPGDVLVFGVPYGTLPCETPSPPSFTRRFIVDGPYFDGGNVYVLFFATIRGQ